MVETAPSNAEGCIVKGGALHAATQTVRSVFPKQITFKEMAGGGSSKCVIKESGKSGGEGDGPSDLEIADSGCGSEDAAHNQELEEAVNSTEEKKSNSVSNEKSHTFKITKEREEKHVKNEIDEVTFDDKCNNWMRKSRGILFKQLSEKCGTKIEKKTVDVKHNLETPHTQIPKEDSNCVPTSSLTTNDSKNERIINYYLTEAHGDTIKMIVPTLTQMHKTMKAMEMKMDRTQEAVDNVAQGLKGQGAMIQRLDRRMDALERRKNYSNTSTRSASCSPSTSRFRFSTPSYPHPNPIIGRSASCPRKLINKSQPSIVNTRHQTPGRSTSCTPSNSSTSNQSRQPQTPLPERFAVLGKRLLNESHEGNVKNVKKLLECGADPNYLGAGRCSTLHRAASKSHADVMELLLAKGALVNAKNCQGSTPLHVAAERDLSGRCVGMLVEAKAEIDINNRFGRTALHCAAERGNSKAVFMLVDAGANKNAIDYKGKTPLDLTKCISVRRILQMSSRSCRSGFSKTKKRSLSSCKIP